MKRTIIISLLILFVICLFLENKMDVSVNLDSTFEYSSIEHLLGTDNLGRDIFSLIVLGFTRTLSVVIVASFISFIIGVSTGLISGYFGGNVSSIIKFITDLLMVIPSLVIALIITAIFGINPISAGVALGLGNVGVYTNQADILTRKIKDMEYIYAVKMIGIPKYRIIFYHIFINILNPMLVLLGNTASNVTLQYASLTFIGIGADLNKPDWGAMIFQYRIYIINSPLLIIWPTLAIFLLSLIFHYMFDKNYSLKKVGNLYE